MKKKIIVGIVIVLLILGLYMYYIHNIKGNFFEANNKEVIDEVSMIIKEGTLTSATIVIKNSSNGELRKGNYIKVKEVYDNRNKIELCAEFTIE